MCSAFADIKESDLIGQQCAGFLPFRRNFRPLEFINGDR